MWTAILLIVIFQLQMALTQLPIREDGRGGSSSSGGCRHHDCSEEKLHPVCGTDGRTYDSMCHLNKAKCEGRQVDFKYRGSCVDNENCFAKRAQIELQGETTIFKPECKEDGSYKEVQCFKGYCWCVDSFGKPIRSASARNTRPHCFRRPKVQPRRRSSRGKKEKKACGNSDRATMNTNLIEIFRSEYNRFPQPTDTNTKDILLDTEQKRIIQWKFGQLDLDNDNYLKQDEVRDLKRMVKKIVKPKPCSRILIKYCDEDKDKTISRTEWSSCLGVDLNISLRLFMSLYSEEQTENPEEEETSQDPDRKLNWDRMNTNVIQNTFVSDDDEPQDCPTRRRKRIEINRQYPKTGAFVPECTDNGLYLQTQCHKKKTNVVCWCVNPRTGEPIPSIPAMKERSDCESVRKNVRSFKGKGCSVQKKQLFLSEFLKSLQEEMATSKKEKTSRTYSTIQEQAARWKFDNLDVNNNKLLEKREWDIFREQWKQFQQGNQKRRKFKKCWRNLPKFCDGDNNKEVTTQEWLKCVGIDKTNFPFDTVKRNGTNPLSLLQHDDD
ncbi:SPARC-related modular calcium-binding protein 1-like isoform X1 [Centruroides vittatus]|uniref:SPARC-related modular calcium-binding protein 1-like isoform X1 n=1 Tax=Centruroides vittatus TaxID=120091 RepID=UPI00350F212E